MNGNYITLKKAVSDFMRTKYPIKKEPILTMGAMAPPVAKQLKAQRLKFEAETVRRFQGQLDAATTLRVNDYLTEKQTSIVRRKIVKALHHYLRRLNPSLRN